MNKKLVFNIMGRLLKAVSLMLLVPMIVSLIYGEKSFVSFLITASFTFLLGTILAFATKNYSKTMYAKEGFVIVALAWLSMSLIGALPLYISREVPSFVDSFFEIASGFTTTGASVINNIDEISNGILFWRSFTHWIGGMGVLVFMLAFISTVSDRSIHILRAEMPGPIVGKLTPKAKDTSKVLYIIYIVLTLLQIILLSLGEMNLFESIIHALGTAGTGGFGIKPDSLAGYSAYSQWIITVFMFIFGINFNIFYLIILKRIKPAIKSTELRVYTIIILTSIALITFNVLSMFDSFSDALRAAALQVVSITTTTGFASVDFNLWPTFSKTILLVLMFIGACAGSTAGGLKMSRLIILTKSLGKEIRRMIHPRAVAPVSFEGKEIDDHVKHSVANYFVVYFFVLFAVFLLISFEPFDIETNFSAAVSCFNNIGPGFSHVGPMSSYADYSPFSKVVLSMAMLLGRLEIYPLLISFIPSTWKKR